MYEVQQIFIWSFPKQLIIPQWTFDKEILLLYIRLGILKYLNIINILKFQTGLIDVWTFPRLDISPTDTSPTGQFPDRHFPDLTFPRPDISPTGQFSDWTFPRADIYSTAHFPSYTFPPSTHIISEPKFP